MSTPSAGRPVPPGESEWFEVAGVIALGILVLLLFFFCPERLPTSIATETPAPVIAKSFSRESIGERETRAALGRIYHGKPFVNVRPPWLVNPETKRRLELDCYNQDLNLGVEYGGKQHYVFPNVFHRTREAFDAQLRRDRYKVEQCRDRGVCLIVVPYTIPLDQIEAFLRNELLQIPLAALVQEKKSDRDRERTSS